MTLVFDEVRATRDSLRYGYAVGKVRVLETRALDRPAVERLLDARDFAEQKRLLSETPYARYLEDATTAEEVERALEDALDGFYRFLDEAALPPAVVTFFRIRYDYANLKAALKAELVGVSTSGLLMEHGTVPSAMFTGSLAELPEPFASVAAGVILDAGAAEIDAAIDVRYFAALLDTAREARSSYLADVARLAIDLANAKILMRGALAGSSAEENAERLIDGGTVPREKLRGFAASSPREIAESLVRVPGLKGLRAGEIVDPALLDPATDALVTAALRRGRREAAGPEPVIAYVMGREAEVRTLRVLLLGTLTGIDENTLRVRVDATYR